MAEEATKRAVRKRVNKAPDPRFRPDMSELLDPILGCPALALSARHPARLVKEELESLDFAEAEARYSSQGQHGYHPRHVFGALVYGSLIGIHQSTKLESALATDLALRFVAGGHAISAGRLRAFRRENLELYVRLQGQLLRIANERGMLLTNELAVDSVRLRAHASTKAVRTMKRSRARLKELSAVDVTVLFDEARLEHEASVERHRAAVQVCEEQQRTNVVLTSPSAGLMKFPNGASGPGHRATVVASGVKERFIVDVLIDSDANDFGKLGPAILRARKALGQAGVALDKPMQVAGDAGYFSAEDLAFAANNRTWVDTLVAERSSKKSAGKDGASLFDVDDFKRDVSGKLTCPAQRAMNGPWKDGDAERWEGIECGGCGLKPRCTGGARRTVTIDLEFHKVRDAMRERMAMPGARERYNQRIATVEPVFSVLEDAMGFRRVTSRVAGSVRAEVLLKVVAYNLKRLIDSKRVRAVSMLIQEKALSSPEDGS
jgi:transposase